MLEKLVFNLLACSLFIIIFFKIIRRDDANYIILLVLQAIGITISFIEIKLGIDLSNFSVAAIRYIIRADLDKVFSFELGGGLLEELRLFTKLQMESTVKNV